MLILFRMFKLVSILFSGWLTDKVGIDQDRRLFRLSVLSVT